MWFLVSVVLSLLLTHWIRNLATAHGWVRGPSLDRHVHINSVPRLGGVAIYLSFMMMAGVALLAPTRMAPTPRLPMMATLSILGPALIIFLLGLYDDLHPIGPSWKLG